MHREAGPQRGGLLDDAAGEAKLRGEMHAGDDNLKFEFRFRFETLHQPEKKAVIGPASGDDADSLLHGLPSLALLGRLTSLRSKLSALETSILGQSRYIGRRCISVHAGLAIRPAALSASSNASRCNASS